LIPAAFEYVAPTSLDEALSLLASYGDTAKVLAGGQSLFPLMKLRLVFPAYLIDLGRVPGLAFVEGNGAGQQDGSIRIGAMTLYREIEDSELVQRECALLAQTAALVADVQVRNRGTIGGSLAHADPTGDMPAAAIALGAEMRVVGPRGERVIPAADFLTGFFSTDLSPDELLTEIRVPRLAGWRSAYLKAAPRASGFTIAGVAVCLRLGADSTCEEIRIGVTGVTDKPFRATSVEAALRGRRLDERAIQEAAASVTDGLWVMDDLRASETYRAHIARLYTARAILAAIGG